MPDCLEKMGVPKLFLSSAEPGKRFFSFTAEGAPVMGIDGRWVGTSYGKRWELFNGFDPVKAPLYKPSQTSWLESVFDEKGYPIGLHVCHSTQIVYDASLE